MDGAQSHGWFLLQPHERKVHAYRKSKFSYCPRVLNRLVNGRAVLVHQELSSSAVRQ
jgi:hypothetical protein